MNNNQVVLITGASRGIGLGIAKEYAALGNKLILTEIEERIHILRSRAKEIEEEFEVEVKALSLDITNIRDISIKIGALEAPFNRINTLINNAGINIIKDSLDITEEDWDKVSDVNLKGTFFVTKEVVKGMIINNIQGSIINISSQHGIIGNEQRAAYCATKAGIINLSRALAYEWSRYGIRINCISPTYVETDNNREYLRSSKAKRMYLSKIPLREYANPKDISKACLFLSSNDSRLITGQNIVVDGGYTIV